MTIDACCTIGGARDAEFGAAELIAQMDEVGVERAVVHPPARCFAWDNAEGNALTVGAARAYPGRLIAAVTASPWRRDAWDCLRALLDPGRMVLAFQPGVQGFPFSSHLLDPVLERLRDTAPRVPVYAHTGHHAHGAPTQLAMLARRFPELSFIMGHCGATDYADDVVTVCEANRNIYPEASFARPFGFAAKLERLGPGRGIMGSGAPYNDLLFEWGEVRRLVPAEELAAVLGGTLEGLLAGEGVGTGTAR